MIKAKVQLSLTVTLNVEAENEERLGEWLSENTPADVIKLLAENGKNYSSKCSYDEEILQFLRDDRGVDLVI
jgi:hypothetical protein